MARVTSGLPLPGCSLETEQAVQSKVGCCAVSSFLVADGVYRAIAVLGPGGVALADAPSDQRLGFGRGTYQGG